MVLAARLDARGRQLDRRLRVEAEVLRLVDDLRGAELHADVAEHGVDRVLVRLQEVDVAERLGRLRVAGVRDVLAVLDAVARVVERRVRP